LGAIRSYPAANEVRPQLTGNRKSRTIEAALARHRGQTRRILTAWMLQADLLADALLHRLGRFPAWLTAAFDRAGRAVDRIGWQAVKQAARTIEWRQTALAASEPFVLPSEWRAAFVRILAYLGAIGAMSVIAAEMVKPPALPAHGELFLRPAWITVDNPWPAFQLNAPGFSDEPHYAIRRHADGGGRMDTLSFGELGLTSRYLSVTVYRAGSEIADFAPPADDMRARGGELGRVLGLRSALPITTKFGPFQTYEFGIGPFGGYLCVGFLRNMTDARVQISGIACNMNLLVDRAPIACALDRLTLMSAGSAPELARLFAQAELKRSFCGQRDPLIYATPQRANSDVTSSARVRLRGRINR
jgi:hypothetical protein